MKFPDKMATFQYRHDIWIYTRKKKISDTLQSNFPYAFPKWFACIIFVQNKAMLHSNYFITHEMYTMNNTNPNHWTFFILNQSVLKTVRALFSFVAKFKYAIFIEIEGRTSKSNTEHSVVRSRNFISSAITDANTDVKR